MLSGDGLDSKGDVEGVEAMRTMNGENVVVAAGSPSFATMARGDD